MVRPSTAVRSADARCPQGTEVSVCELDKDDLPKVLRGSTIARTGKEKMDAVGLAGVIALFLFWLGDLFVHFVDKLLKGQY